jgi:hypothetical protein
MVAQVFVNIFSYLLIIADLAWGFSNMDLCFLRYYLMIWIVSGMQRTLLKRLPTFIIFKLFGSTIVVARVRVSLTLTISHI